MKALSKTSFYNSKVVGESDQLITQKGFLSLSAVNDFC